MSEAISHLGGSLNKHGLLNHPGDAAVICFFVIEKGSYIVTYLSLLPVEKFKKIRTKLVVKFTLDFANVRTREYLYLYTEIFRKFYFTFCSYFKDVKNASVQKFYSLKCNCCSINFYEM